MTALIVLAAIAGEIGFALFMGRLLRGPKDRFTP